MPPFLRKLTVYIHYNAFVKMIKKRIKLREIKMFILINSLMKLLLSLRFDRVFCYYLFFLYNIHPNVICFK